MSNRCLDYKAFKKYMKEFIHDYEMNVDSVYDKIQTENHIMRCDKCKKKYDDFMNLLENCRNEKDFWKNFEQYWQSEGKAVNSAEIGVIDLIKNAVTSKSFLPDWVSDLKSMLSIEMYQPAMAIRGKDGILACAGMNHERAKRNYVERKQEPANIKVTIEPKSDHYNIYILVNKMPEGEIVLEGDDGEIRPSKVDGRRLAFKGLQGKSYKVKYKA